MFLSQDTNFQQQPTLNVSAKLIASIRILQLSSEELAQAIALERDDNPAFEVEEHAQCPQCGSQLQNGSCITCASRQRDEHTSVLVSEWDFDRYMPDSPNSLGDGEEGLDPMERLHAEQTLSEVLLEHLLSLVEEQDAPIAEYLIGNLNQRGYLQVAPADAAATLRVPLERLERVLTALQTQEPVGIGARDLSECLLIQIRFLAERGIGRPLAELIVRTKLRELGEHRFHEVARSLSVSLTEVKDAWRFIRENLNPFPGYAFEASIPDAARSHESLRPDVIIRKTERGFEAEVVESKRYSFRVNPVYRRMAGEPARSLTGISDHERQHVKEYTSRTQFFMDCIQKRWETLSKITADLMVCQHDFLEHGVRHLRPLTRGELATRIGLHESTISRATANKYVMLPEGRTISFDDFFDSSLSTKDTLKGLIAQESEAKPLSDQDLAELLASQGVNIARRTVAKYRGALRILPSKLR